MTSTRFSLLLSLFALLATPAVADTTYAVTGEDMAGTARVMDDGEVLVRYRVFNKDGNTSHQVRGNVTARTETQLDFRWEELIDRSNMVRRLTFWRPRSFESVFHDVSLSADSNGHLTGEVEGRTQTWVAQENTRDMVVLVVPGLSTNLWNQYGVPYLDENMEALRARGLDARRLTINTEESIAVNSAEIAREIRHEISRGKRVLLLAHSKGGADTVTALSDPANRDLLPWIAGLIAIQPVYGGSPVADLVGSDHILQATADQAFERILPAINKEDDTGDRAAVRDLRSASRQALLAQWPFPVDEIPVVCVRGYFSGRPMWKPRHVLRKPLWMFQYYLEWKDNLQTDGLVSLEWQRIPGADVEITLADLDHFEPGFRGESPHSPAEVTNTGINAILPLLQARPAPRRHAIDQALGAR
ncbi:hypothetical protein OAX78_00195 [Planctomycetota bacterium]|nr:hypothetical protein [Planctomycetota bacterium]